MEEDQAGRGAQGKRLHDAVRVTRGGPDPLQVGRPPRRRVAAAAA
jgi:hypothetical protein